MHDDSGESALTEPSDGDLVDVTRLPLADLVSVAGDTVLARSLRRLLEEMDDPQEVIAGWSSFQP